LLVINDSIKFILFPQSTNFPLWQTAVRKESKLQTREFKTHIKGITAFNSMTVDNNMQNYIQHTFAESDIAT